MSSGCVMSQVMNLGMWFLKLHSKNMNTSSSIIKIILQEQVYERYISVFASSIA